MPILVVSGPLAVRARSSWTVQELCANPPAFLPRDMNTGAGSGGTPLATSCLLTSSIRCTPKSCRVRFGLAFQKSAAGPAYPEIPALARSPKSATRATTIGWLSTGAAAVWWCGVERWISAVVAALPTVRCRSRTACRVGVVAGTGWVGAGPALRACSPAPASWVEDTTAPRIAQLRTQC